MSRHVVALRLIVTVGLCTGAMLIPVPDLQAQHPIERSRGRLVVTQAHRAYDPAASPAPLGTFEPTPYIMVRGSWPAGGGYSPLGVYGDQAMSIYGPFSPMRSASAPVLTYTRGYDGRLYPTESTSFSTPNLPGISPVIYPTPGNYYYGPRENRTPPWWSNGFNWLDQQ